MEKLNDINLMPDKEDLENLKRLTSYKNNLMNSIGMDVFIDEVRNIIDNSKYFEFRSPMSKKFIDKDRPIFIIKMNDEMASKYCKINKTDDKIINKRVNEITETIKNCIIEKISNYLTNYIYNNQELKEYFESFNETMKNLFISSIYGIRVNLQDNIIYLEYMK